MELFSFFSFLYIILFFIYLAVLDLHCFSGGGGGQAWNFSPVAVQGLLTVVASLSMGRTGSRARGLQWPWRMGSGVVASQALEHRSGVVVHRPSCSSACGIFPAQELNSCLLWGCFLVHMVGPWE